MYLSFFKKNYPWFFFLIALIDFFYSVSLYQYIYDGHHHGYMFANANDLLNGRLPYKEIFIQYGILTTLLHSISILIFGANIISINLITCAFYSLTVFLISQIVAKKTNIIFGLLSLFVIFFNHPIPWYPWSNYFSLFFLVLSFYFFLNLTNINIFAVGISLSLICLSRETYFTVIALVNLLIIIFLAYANERKKIILLILGFAIPYVIFFIYLMYNNIIYDWIDYFKLPQLYLSKYKLNIINGISNGIFYIFFKSWFKIFYHPQNIIISLITIINCLYIFNYFSFKNKKKDIYLFTISSTSLLFVFISVNSETFRLYTTIIIGIIPALNYVFKLKNKENKNIYLFLLIFLSFFSFSFFPKGNNPQFQKINKIDSEENNNIKYFNYQKWEKNNWEMLSQISNTIKTVKKNCNIEFGLNYSFNTFFYLVTDLKMLQLEPAMLDDENAVFKHFENRFKSEIENNIKKNNIILITDGFHKDQFANNDYKTINIYKDKNNIYRDVIYISFPKNCWKE